MLSSSSMFVLFTDVWRMNALVRDLAAGHWLILIGELSVDGLRGTATARSNEALRGESNNLKMGISMQAQARIPTGMARSLSNKD